MAEEKKQEKKQGRKFEKKEEKKGRREEFREESLVRIMSTDIPGEKKLLAGLTRIKGISWSFSNSVCRILGLDKNKKIKDINEQEKEKIIEFVRNPKVPFFILNRRKDFESGISKHLTGSDLDLQREFDVKRLKKIRCYKGMRHALGQPVRGQRTKSHFRKGKAIGVRKGKMKNSGK